MRDFLKASGRCFASAWFWSLVLLALPHCALRHDVTAPPRHLATGDLPHSSAIMCDIERYPGPTRRCATDQDLRVGIRLAMAAEALVAGHASSVGLDFSPAAEAACAGRPQAIDFQGSFPDGSVVCLNCGQVIPTPHANATAVCIARCQDLVEHGEAPRPPDILAFCTAHAHPSTNPPASTCYDDACSTGGTLRTDFVDPRRFAEPVHWTDQIGTVATGSTLTRMAETTGTGTVDLNAGAVSMERIEAKDGYVEFEANETDKTHVAGLSQVLAGCPSPCADNEPHIVDINFAISLNSDGQVYVLEGGAVAAGPFGPYAAHERFRVKVTDHFDGNATVTYSRITGPCVPGHPCNEMDFYIHVGLPAAYPLRVDTSFREQGATLANVNIVRIQ